MYYSNTIDSYLKKLLVVSEGSDEPQNIAGFVGAIMCINQIKVEEDSDEDDYYNLDEYIEHGFTDNEDEDVYQEDDQSNDQYEDLDHSQWDNDDSSYYDQYEDQEMNA